MPAVIWPDGMHLAATVTLFGWLLTFVLAYGTRARPARAEASLGTVLPLVRAIPVAAQESRAA